MSYSWLIRHYHGCEYGLQTCLLTLKRRQSTKSQSSGTKDDLIEGFILAAAAQAKHISVLHFSPLFSSPLPLIVCMLMLYLSAGGTTCLVGEWPTFWVPAGLGCSGSGHQNCYIGPGCHYSPEGHPDSPWSFRDSQWNQSQGSDRNLHPISSQLKAPAVLDWGGMPWLHYSIGWGVSSTIISLQPLLSPGRWDSGPHHWGPWCPDFTWWWLHCGSCCLLYQWQALDYTHFSQSLSQLLTTLHLRMKQSIPCHVPQSICTDFFARFPHTISILGDSIMRNLQLHTVYPEPQSTTPWIQYKTWAA